MSDADPDDDRAEDLTALYRAANAADTARPSEGARRSILAYARTVAGDHATRGSASAPTPRPRPNYSSWHMSAAASVIVAGFATLLAWHFRAPTSESSRQPLGAQPGIATDVETKAGPEHAAGSSASSAASEPAPIERPSAPDPAPNAVTARSSERRFVREHTSRPDPYAGLEGGSVASLRQAPVKAARPSAANNATEASRASDAAALENPASRAQLAASAAPPPPSFEARQPPAPGATSSGHSGAAPGSPLVTAAESGDLAGVDQLLRSGVGTEQTDARGRTALLVATLRGDIPMVRRLLAAGARVDVADAEGDTPLAAARRQGPGELERLLERATQPP
jgi:hypothetical protein